MSILAMGNSILNNKNSQVIDNRHTWLSYYIQAIYYLGHRLLLDRAPLHGRPVMYTETCPGYFSFKNYANP